MKAPKSQEPSSEELIVQLGEQARKLGCDQVFKETLKAVKERQMLIIAQSAPEKVEIRESAYHLMRALGQIEETFTIIQNAGDRMKAETTRRRKNV